MKTILLDRTIWDLVSDANSNIAVGDDPYAIAQNVATAIKTFLGECWFDTSIGVPHWQILGQWPPLAFVRRQLQKAAESVPGVVKARVYFSSFDLRKLSGQVQVTDKQGNIQGVAF